MNAFHLLSWLFLYYYIIICILFNFSYVEKLRQGDQRKVSPKPVKEGGAVGPVNSGEMAGMMPASQVDIMQMLSKAQKEYDTVSLIGILMFSSYFSQYACK